MEIKKGTKLINNNTKKAIIEFVFENYIIFVFQGDLSDFDILIKYKKGEKRIRTPRHIHWAVDILMKMQGNEALTKNYLKSIKTCWDNCTPLTSNDFEALKSLIENGEKDIEIGHFFALNAFGEYDVEFLYVLMELLAVQEKTNRADAYMFGKIIDELLETDKDIFKIISTAGYTGRKG